MPACARGNGVDEVFSAFAVSVPSSGDCFFLYGVKWRRAERKEANSGSASENPKALRGLPKPASLLSTRLPDMGWREEAHQQSNAYPLSLSRQISLQPTHLVRPETTPYRGWSLFLLPGRPRADFGFGAGFGFFLLDHCFYEFFCDGPIFGIEQTQFVLHFFDPHIRIGFGRK